MINYLAALPGPLTQTNLLIGSAVAVTSLRRHFCTKGRSFNNGIISLLVRGVRLSGLKLTGIESGIGTELAGEVESDKLINCFTWTCDSETKLLIDSAKEVWSLWRRFCTEGRSFNNGVTSLFIMEVRLSSLLLLELILALIRPVWPVNWSFIIDSNLLAWALLLAEISAALTELIFLNSFLIAKISSDLAVLNLSTSSLISELDFFNSFHQR